MEALIDVVIRTSHAMLEWAFNGLWSGLLITGIVVIVLQRARKTSAATRYAIWWLTLGMVVVLPFFLSRTQDGAVGSLILEKTVLPATVSAAPTEPAASIPAERSMANPALHREFDTSSLVWALLPPIFVLAWLLISVTLIVKLYRTYLRMTWIKKGSRPLDRPEEIPCDLPAKLRVSDEIHYPMAAGLGNPMILIPADLAEALSSAELRAVILHEAAHIVRRDDWTRLAQKIVQAFFIVIPAVHWIGRHLDLERELACDGLVVERTRTPGDYCRCLTRLMELTYRAGSSLAPAALTRRKQIIARFERILRADPGRAARFSRFRFTCALGLLAAAALLFILTVPAVAVPLDNVTFADVKACLAGDSDEQAAGEAPDKAKKIFIPPELADRLETLPEGKIVDWTLKIYSLPISFTLRSTDGEEEVATIWINDKRKLRAVLRGSVRFAEDDRSIRWISSPGFFAVLDESGPERLELEVKPGPIVAFFRNGQSQKIDQSARAWMADIYSALIRKSGMGAQERVARILHRHGVNGVLEDVSRLESPWVQQEYLAELIDSDRLVGKNAVSKTLEVIDSLPDINKARLLIDIHPICLAVGLIEAHDEAVRGMESRYEKERVIDALK